MINSDRKPFRFERRLSAARGVFFAAFIIGIKQF